MTRRRRVFAIIGVALAVAVLLVLYLVFRAGGPAYHNACIERAMTSAVEIEIRHKAWQSPDHVPVKQEDTVARQNQHHHCRCPYQTVFDIAFRLR